MPRLHRKCCICNKRVPSNTSFVHRVYAPTFIPKFRQYIVDKQLNIEHDQHSIVCHFHYGIISRYLNPVDENGQNLNIEDQAPTNATGMDETIHELDSRDVSSNDTNIRELEYSLKDPNEASRLLKKLAEDKEIAVQIFQLLLKDVSLSEKVAALVSDSALSNSQYQQQEPDMLDSDISLGQRSLSFSQDLENDLIHKNANESLGSFQPNSVYSQPMSELEFLDQSYCGTATNPTTQTSQGPLENDLINGSASSLLDHNYCGTQRNETVQSQISSGGRSQDSSLSLDPGTQRSSQSAKTYFLAKGVKCAKLSENRCFICGKDTRFRVPKEAKKQAWMELLILIPENNRCCLSHRTPEKHFTTDALSKIEAAHESTYMTAQDLGEFLVELTQSRKNELAIDFRNPNMKDVDYKLLTGFGKKVFDKLLSYIDHRINNTDNRNKKNALGMFQMAMRLNFTQSVLAHLFKTSQPTVSHAIESVSDALEEEFVPHFLGRKCLSRDEAVRNHSRQIVNKLFDADNKLVEIWDGTYIYIEAPGDNDLQRNFYSGQKKRHLIKIMISCLSSGRIVEVSDAYTANSNDATIQALMMNESEELRNYYREGDIMIVDRGFRDSVSLMKEYGLQVFTPTDAGGNRPFTTREANLTRRVTLVRWLIEAVNGRLKNLFRFFAGSAIEAGYMKQVPKFVRICCAMINAFCEPLLEDKPEHEFIGTQVLNLINKSNDFYEQKIKEKHLMPRITKDFEKLTAHSIVDFPKLSWDELLGLTLGVYQLRRAQKYIKEHIQENPEFELHYYLIQESPILIRTRLQSRHINSKKYDIFVEADASKIGLDAIVGWWCSCKSGARVVGCCSHVAALIRFLSYDCHQPTAQNARKRVWMSYINANKECKNKGIQIGQKRKKDPNNQNNVNQNRNVESESSSDDDVFDNGLLLDSDELLDI